MSTDLLDAGEEMSLFDWKEKQKPDEECFDSFLLLALKIDKSIYDMINFRSLFVSKLGITFIIGSEFGDIEVCTHSEGYSLVIFSKGDINGYDNIGINDTVKIIEEVIWGDYEGVHDIIA